MLPDTITLHNNIHDKGAGIIFGNYIMNVGANEETKQLESENTLLKNTIRHQEEQIFLLKDQIDVLKKAYK
jgi:hypothetical protein